MKHYQFVIVLGLAATLAAQTPARGGTVGRVDMSTLRTPIYTAEDGAFVRHNGDRFNNRPLYCNQLTAIVVAGDRPLMRFGSGSVLDGTFMAALVRGNKAKWLHDWSDITSKYSPDHMLWILKDGGFGATVLTLDVVPPAEGAGMAARLRIEKAEAGDRLIWVCGGAVQQKESMLAVWDVTTAGRQRTLTRTFSPDECRDNRVTIDGDGLMLQLGEKPEKRRPRTLQRRIQGHNHRRRRVVEPVEAPGQLYLLDKSREERKQSAGVRRHKPGWPTRNLLGDVQRPHWQGT